MEQYQIKNLYRAGLVLLVVLSLTMVVKIFKGPKHFGMGYGQMNTITLSGTGEVSATPDIANIYFTIHKEAKTVKEAQDAVATVEKAALDFLKTNNVLEKDIKATNSSFNPKYEYKYKNVSVPCNQYGCPPYNGNNVIVGYEAHENITVKVRNVDDAGKITEGLGALGVSELNGPNYAIDDEDGLQAQARKMAIDDAKAKAEALAEDLGVRLKGVTSFSENGNYPMPYFYGKEMMSTMGAADQANAELPKGQNTITSNVTITYEIK